MAAAVGKTKGTVKYSIGQVLQRLAPEFEDLTLSKLRFLEDQGLITPEREGSGGYRKFTQAHIERLRLILTLQRDHYLPLKKISEVLEEVDAGKDPLIPGASQRNFSSILSPRQVLTRDELARAAGVKTTLIAEAISAGLLPSVEVFPADALLQVSALASLAERGLTPRHLRSLRLAAEKEAAVIQQAVTSRIGKKDGPEHYEESLLTADLFDTVRSAVVRQVLRRG